MHPRSKVAMAPDVRNAHDIAVAGGQLRIVARVVLFSFVVVATWAGWFSCARDDHLGAAETAR